MIIGGPFNSGILAGRETWNYAKAPQEVMDRVKAIARVCDAHGVPLAAAALQFPLAHPLVASTIPGPRSADGAQPDRRLDGRRRFPPPCGPTSRARA